MIIVFTVIQGAFGTYLLSSVLGTFPREILEAARIDGAQQAGRSCGGSWSRSAGPPSAVLLIFFFIWTWNEFFLPLIMLISNDNQTVPVALGVAAGRPADGRHDDQRRRRCSASSRPSSSSSSSSAP